LKFDHNSIDIAYCSSHEDHKERGVKGRGPFKDDLSYLEIEALEFDSNLKPENYSYWVQAVERIIEFKGYNDKKVCRLAIL